MERKLLKAFVMAKYDLDEEKATDFLRREKCGLDEWYEIAKQEFEIEREKGNKAV